MNEKQRDVFIEQLQFVLDNQLDVQDIPKLQQQLENDPDARDIYVEFMTMSSLLSDPDQFQNVHDNQQTGNLLREIVEADQILSHLNQAQINKLQSEKIEKQAKEKLNEFLGNQKTEPIDNNSSVNSDRLESNIRLKLPMIKVLAASIILGICLWLFLQPQFPSQIALLRKTVNAQWETSPGKRLYNQPYQLNSGLAEIEFNDGAKIILEGPAEITLESANGAYLKKGKLVAYVPDAARGFTVNTPFANFVDYGTEFGLVVDDASSEMSVFEGEVKVELQDKSSTQIVPAGESKHVVAGDHQIHDVISQTDYIRHLSEEVVVKPMEANFCKEPHWRLSFNDMQKMKAEHKVKAVGDFNFDPQGPALKHLPDNQAMMFKGDNHLNVNLQEQEIDNEEFTLSMWIKCNSKINQCIYMHHIDNFEADQVLYIERDKNNHTYLKYLFCMENKQEGHRTKHKIFRAKDYVPGQWMHVVIVFTKEKAVFYLNGQYIDQALIPAGYQIKEHPASYLTFGYAMNMTNIQSLELKSGKQFPGFNGSIDEFSIYQCELKGDQIQQLYSQSLW